MIAIKNREMPLNCLMCSEKYDPENRVCGFDGHVFEETFAVVTNKRDKDCPLVEIEERKVGKWIRKPIRNDKGGCIGAEMICSCCNKYNRHDEYMDYCPNCECFMKED